MGLLFQTMDKKGFLLYATQWAALRQMSNSELGGAIRELCGYAFDGITPERPSVAFMFLKAQIDIDEQKYQEKCEKNRANISKRWNTEDTNVYDRIQSDTKRTNKEDKENKEENIDENKDIEKKNKQEKAEQSSSPKFVFKKALIDRGCSNQIASDYMAIRNKRRAPSTITAFERIEKEAEKYISARPGATFEDVVRLMIEHNWLGFEAAWVKDTGSSDSEESEYVKAMNAQIRRQREIDAELEAERQRRKREAANNNK